MRQIFSILLVICALSLQAQTRPQFPELKVKEDYANAEPLFLQATQWLNETDLDKQLDIRQATSRFVVQWLMGSPTVNVVLTDKATKLFVPDNPPLLTIYMANFGAYCINNKEDKEQLAAAKAALKQVAVVYKKGIGVKKSKLLKKLADSVEANQLDKFMDENFKS